MSVCVLFIYSIRGYYAIALCVYYCVCAHCSDAAFVDMTLSLCVYIIVRVFVGTVPPG